MSRVTFLPSGRLPRAPRPACCAQAGCPLGSAACVPSGAHRAPLQANPALLAGTAAFRPRGSLPSAGVCPASSPSPAPCVGCLVEPSEPPAEDRSHTWPSGQNGQATILKSRQMLTRQNGRSRPCWAPAPHPRLQLSRLISEEQAGGVGGKDEGQGFRACLHTVLEIAGMSVPGKGY